MYKTARTNLRQLVHKADFWLTAAAAIAYSSWPLGFIFNPSVAHRAFASQLEASHQPYNWLFVALDIVSGLLLTVVGLRQWRRLTKHWLLRLGIVAYIAFAVLVIAAAVMPDNCPTGALCTNVMYTPAYLIHGYSSIVSVVFLFAGMVLPAPLLVRRQQYHWVTLLAVFVALGWGLTGLGALLELVNHVKGNWLQYGLISVCSLTMLVSVGLIERSAVHNLVPKRET